MNSSQGARLPIVTIGGFLGAGKTTLVNRILSESHGYRFVVFVNDFGAVNIDHDLVETTEANRISLKNGCVCCSLNQDLVGQVAEFARSQCPPHGVLIETSGVADPRALVSSFSALEAAGLARLDTKVYVMDVQNYDRLPFDDGEAIIDHAASSDLVLLNKTDLCSFDKVENTLAVLDRCAPYAKVIPTENCDVPMSVIFCVPGDHALSAGDPGSSKDQRQRQRQGTRGEGETNHSVDYASRSYAMPKLGDGAMEFALVDRGRFDELIKALPAHCIRSKGVFWFSDNPTQPYVFNLVGFRASLEKMNPSGIVSGSRVVAIGHRSSFQPRELDALFVEKLGLKPV